VRGPVPDRSASIYFVHVRGRLLYIVDRPTVVVEGGNVLHHIKGGNCLGRVCPGGNGRIPSKPVAVILLYQMQPYFCRNTQVDRHTDSVVIVIVISTNTGVMQGF